MNVSITTAAKNLINLVYPLHCASCRKPLDSLNEFGVCASCIAKIRPNPKPHFTSSDFDRAYSACLYEGTLKELIHAFKYKKKLALLKLFSQLLTEYIKSNPEISKNTDIITFVPLHKSRLREREFNQSKLLASKISEALNLPLVDTLNRTNITRNQNELTRKERLINLSGAFEIRKDISITGKSILLVDDVLTTGATLNECANVLKKAGASKVICLTLARGL